MSELRKPLVLINRVPTQLPETDILDAFALGLAADLVNNTSLQQLELCPVCLSTGAGFGGFIPARANSFATAAAVGLLLQNTPPSVSGVVQMTGMIGASVQSWNVVANTNQGLIPGSEYWLSAAIAGRITRTPPDRPGEFLCKIGRAISAQIMFLQIEPIIGL